MGNSSDNIILATELTVAWLANPNTRVGADAVPAFLTTMYVAVGDLGSAAADPKEAVDRPLGYIPAVSVRKSLADPDYIVSMIDGRKYRALKRHLASHGLSPDEYRQRYGLKADYPMNAPGYSEARRAIAKKIGLGRKPGTKVAKAADQEQRATTARKGISVAEAKAAAKAHLGGSKS